MPADDILHKGNAFPFESLTDNSSRHAFNGFGFFKSSTQLIKIIAVCAVIAVIGAAAVITLIVVKKCK